MEQKPDQPICCYRSQLNELRLNGEFVDMEIIVGPETFRVHRLAMAAKSDYFRTVMSSQLREARENRVIIEDVDPEIMRTVIEFCYTNEVSLNDNNFRQVLSAAFRFCMESLKDLCVEFIQPRMSPSNCTGLIHSFQLYSLKHLLDIAIGFCLENFDLIHKTPKFSDIEEHVWEILLPDDRLNLSESGIFRALVKWAEHDLENRKAAFERLVKHVRFATIDASELEKLSVLKLARMSGSCKELIEKAKYHQETEYQDRHSEDEPLAEVSATQRRNLKNCQRMYAIGGRAYARSGSFRYFETLSSVEIFNHNTDEWTEAAPMHSQREEFGCALFGDDIYVAGGIHGGQTLNTFERYSIANDTWQSLPAMPTARHGLGLVALGEYLYAIGGSNMLISYDHLDLVERFHPGERRWDSCARMLIPRLCATYVALGGYIYAIGGNSKSYVRTTLEKYDPETDSWCRLTSLFQVIERFQCTCYKGTIQIMRLDERTRSHLELFVYNPSTDRWTEMRAPTDRRCIEFVELGRELYAVGGPTNDSTLNLVKSYNPETYQWTARTGTTTNRSSCGLIVHPQRMFPDKHLLAPLFKKKYSIK